MTALRPFLTGLMIATALPMMAQPALAGFSCGDREMVYEIDEANVTGWRHNIMDPVPPETVRLGDGGNLILERDGDVIAYETTGGGTGIRTRVGRTSNLGEDDPRREIRYTFYDITDKVAEGQPDHFLMIDGDIYWPACR